MAVVRQLAASALLAPRVIATDLHYGRLLDVFRLRIIELETTYDSVGDVVGASDRKVSMWLSGGLSGGLPSRMNVYNVFDMLDALGLKMQIVEYPEQLAKMRPHLHKPKRASGKYLRLKRSAARIFTLDPQYMEKLGAKGGKARAASLTKQQLSEAGRAAIVARWRAVRAAAKAKAQASAPERGHSDR